VVSSKQQKIANFATIEPGASAALRDQVIAELKGLNSTKEASGWGIGRLPQKLASLVFPDAKQVELAFQLKLSTLMTDHPTAAEKPEPRSRGRRRRDQPPNVDKTVLTLLVPRRVRDRQHVKSVAKQPCESDRATPVS
jgi:hypothetical protein